MGGGHLNEMIVMVHLDLGEGAQGINVERRQRAGESIMVVIGMRRYSRNVGNQGYDLKKESIGQVQKKCVREWGGV